MAPLDEKWRLRFDGCGLEISARRLLEHIELGQINPFPPLTRARANQAQLYVDIVDSSEPVETLTGLTLADLLAGKHGGMPEALVGELLSHVNSTPVRRWLAGVEEQMRQFSQQRAQRNMPEPFLPVDTASALSLRGLHCALPEWLKAHATERASIAQWSGRLENLASKGLRAEEMAFSGLSEWLMDETGKAVTGDVISSCLNYDAVRLSIVPVIRPARSQLEFVKVPANATVKRIKPKLKARLVTHPQWRDRVLGYWVDAVEWSDLLSWQQGWMAFTHRGQPIVSRRKPSGLCATYREAQALANSHAEKIFPKMTARGKWSQFRQTGGKQYREWLVTLPYYSPSFFSSHFEHRNVFLHVRCDMREGPQGARVLVLQEVQSDWAQQARRALALGPDAADLIAVPPWLQEWPALALKLMLLHAAQLGAGALAWTRGEVQVDRYLGLGKVGLRELYDRTLPNEANRLLRPFGRKCETVELFQPTNFYIEPADIGYEVFDDAKQSVGKAASWEEAQALLPDGAHEELKTTHSVRLDADLRHRLLATGLHAWGGGIR